MAKIFIQIVLDLGILYGIVLLFLCIKKWDWLSKHPELFTWWSGINSFDKEQLAFKSEENIKSKFICRMLIFIIASIFCQVLIVIR